MDGREIVEPTPLNCSATCAYHRILHHITLHGDARSLCFLSKRPGANRAYGSDFPVMSAGFTVGRVSNPPSSQPLLTILPNEQRNLHDSRIHRRVVTSCSGRGTLEWRSHPFGSNVAVTQPLSLSHSISLFSHLYRVAREQLTNSTGDGASGCRSKAPAFASLLPRRRIKASLSSALQSSIPRDATFDTSAPRPRCPPAH